MSRKIVSKIAVATAAAALVLTGCSSSGVENSEDAAFQPQPTVTSLTKAVQNAGLICETGWQEPNDNAEYESPAMKDLNDLGASYAVCNAPGGLIATFDSTEDRDKFLGPKDEFAGNAFVGDTFIVTVAQQDVSVLADSLDGETWTTAGLEDEPAMENESESNHHESMPITMGEPFELMLMNEAESAMAEPPMAEFTVTDVAYEETSTGGTPTDGVFVILTLDVKNTGSEPMTPDAPPAVWLGADGEQTGAAAYITSTRCGEDADMELLPDRTAEVCWTYEVPDKPGTLAMFEDINTAGLALDPSVK